MKELIQIQQKLKAPKGQFNSFGKYKYRSCENILEAVKPLLKETNCILLCNDELIQIGDRYYVKATATITNSEGQQISTNSYAREEENKKGMDGSQITGTSSSYARKYALNGLFCIDDTKDSDTTNDHQTKEKDETNTYLSISIQDIKEATTLEALQQIWNKWSVFHQTPQFKNTVLTRKQQLTTTKTRNNGDQSNI